MRKSYRTLAVTAVLGFGLGLSACSDDKVAGGGPSGSEAGNAITAQILTADEKPAALAKVKLIESESTEGTKNAYTAETNKDGKVVIENVSEGHYIMEASLEGKAVQMSVDVKNGEIDLGSAKLGKTVEVSGDVNEKSGVVKVRGMDHSAEVVNGKFSMDSLPAGPLSLVFISANDTTSSYIKTDEGSKAKASTFAGENEYLLLEDFQDSNYQNRFMPAHTYDGGWWYFSTDSMENALFTDKDGKPTLENDDGNIYLHVGAINGNGWPTVGVELGKSNKELYCNDISSVDSIVFKARGTGNIYVTLVDETLDEGQRDILQTHMTLSSEWEEYSIPTNLVNPAYSLKCVNQITWKLSSASVDTLIDLQLDDVKLYGGDRLTIWER